MHFYSYRIEHEIYDDNETFAIYEDQYKEGEPTPICSVFITSAPTQTDAISLVSAMLEGYTEQ